MLVKSVVIYMTYVRIDFMTSFVNLAPIYTMYCTCLQGGPANGSLPVDLLIEEVVTGGALTANTMKYVSITSILKDRGLALPRRPTG